jgi:hypothetical protein
MRQKWRMNATLWTSHAPAAGEYSLEINLLKQRSIRVVEVSSNNLNNTSANICGPRVHPVDLCFGTAMMAIRGRKSIERLIAG